MPKANPINYKIRLEPDLQNFTFNGDAHGDGADGTLVIVCRDRPRRDPFGEPGGVLHALDFDLLDVDGHVVVLPAWRLNAARLPLSCFRRSPVNARPHAAIPQPENQRCDLRPGLPMRCDSPPVGAPLAAENSDGGNVDFSGA